MPGSIHHMLVSAATGLFLLCNTAALAQQEAAIIAAPDVQRTDGRVSGLKMEGLTGGFYADKFADDGWYFDFYEPRPERTSDRTAVDKATTDASC